jgi:hypothetical protein
MIGIYLMGFVILVAGVGVFGMSLAYAVRPTEQKLVLMRPLSLAAIFAAVCSSSVGVATALRYAGAKEVLTPKDVSVMLMGLSESLIPPFVAFAFLAVAWLVVAVGMRRQA